LETSGAGNLRKPTRTSRIWAIYRDFLGFQISRSPETFTNCWWNMEIQLKEKFSRLTTRASY
jgi:hypothetical protein